MLRPGDDSALAMRKKTVIQENWMLRRDLHPPGDGDRSKNWESAKGERCGGGPAQAVRVDRPPTAVTPSISTESSVIVLCLPAHDEADKFTADAGTAPELKGQRAIAVSQAVAGRGDAGAD